MPFLAAAAVLAASYGTGMALTAGGRIAVDDGLRRRLTVFSAGFATLALVTVLLGLAGAFDRPVLVAVALAGAALALPFVPREAQAVRAAWRAAGARRGLLVAAAAILALDVLLASAPPTSGDATGYHLTAPKEWLEAGRIFSIWWDWNTFQPLATEMHFALALALDGGRAAMLVCAFLGVFSVACVYGLTRELAGRRAAAVAALIWVAQGMFVWEATGGFVELVLSGFVALGAWHLVVLRRSGRILDAALAGLAAGLAAATKFHGLLFVGVFGVLVAVLVPEPARRRLVAVVAFSVLTLVALPWYVRNWAVAGNPLYPFAAGVFGGRYLDAATRADLHQSLAGYGLPGLWRLPFFPLEFLLHTDRYERGYSFSPALFLLPPLAVAQRLRWAWVLAAGILVYLVVWWEVMQQITRYLLPALALAAPLAGWAAVELWDRRGRARGALTAVAVVTAVPLVAITGLFVWRIAPGALGFERQGAFVQRLTGTYDAFRWLDRELPPRGTVLIGIRDLYWLDRPAAAYNVPLFNFGQPTAQAVARLRATDVRYLAFLDGSLPTPLEPLQPQLRELAQLDVPYVTSRALGRVENRKLVVWAWCRAAADPCRKGVAR